MGLLDSKTRIFDTMLTQEGRRQLASGKLKIEYVSLTDNATFYEYDEVLGNSDATKRVYLEVSNLPQDQITFESDDSGKLMSFKNDKGYKIEAGNIYVNINGEQRLLSSNNLDRYLSFFYSDEGIELSATNIEEAYQRYIKIFSSKTKVIIKRKNISTSESVEKVIYDDNFDSNITIYDYVDKEYNVKYIYEYSLYLSYTETLGGPVLEKKITYLRTYNNPIEEATNDLLRSSIDNFNKLQVIGTIDNIFNDSEFSINPNNVNFTLYDNLPIKSENQVTNINDTESFIQDRRLRHIDNFLYLPPIQKVEDHSVDVEKESKNGTLYDNPKIKKIGEYESLGPKYKKSYKDFEYEFISAEQNDCCRIINFDPTSINNRLMFQFFELTSNSISKLDIIEFGTFNTEDYNHPTKKVYFAGKVLINDIGRQTFIHIFTIVLE